jgi:hypothetical protein
VQVDVEPVIDVLKLAGRDAIPDASVKPEFRVRYMLNVNPQ